MSISDRDPMTIKHEIKSQLAKLLATEDLVVEHKKVETAQFNVQSNRRYLWRQTWIVNINWFLCNVGLYLISRNMQPVTDNFWQGGL